MEDRRVSQSEIGVATSKGVVMGTICPCDIPYPVIIVIYVLVWPVDISAGMNPHL
tara:strand:- start:159 stop:323 length:165 start_codon:yes stop_codon:yes gene_type:complete